MSEKTGGGKNMLKNRNGAKNTIMVCLIGAVMLMSRGRGWMENLIICGNL